MDICAIIRSLTSSVVGGGGSVTALQRAQAPAPVSGPGLRGFRGNEQYKLRTKRGPHPFGSPALDPPGPSLGGLVGGGWEEASLTETRAQRQLRHRAATSLGHHHPTPLPAAAHHPPGSHERKMALDGARQWGGGINPLFDR